MGRTILIPADRLGVVSAQPDWTEAVSVVNMLIGKGVQVRWLAGYCDLKTERFPEGHQWGPGGFIVDDEGGLLEELQSRGIAWEIPLSGPGPTVVELRSRRIALYTGKGAADFCTKPLMEVLDWCGFQYRTISDGDIRAGLLDGFDILVAPGGPDAGESYYWGMGRLGYDNIRKFAARGGSYFGICAGAYLTLTSSTNKYWLQMVAATDDQALDYWRTGAGYVRMRIESPNHPFAFGLTAGEVNTADIIYWEGPAMRPVDDSVKILATFQDFIASGARGHEPGWDLLDNTPARECVKNWYNVLTPERFDKHLRGRGAVAETRFREGKVLLYSPHAEFGNIGVGPRKQSQVFQMISNGIYYLSI